MSGVIAGIDSKLLHPGEESGPIRMQARRSSVRSPHPSLRLSECAHDLIALPFRTIIRRAAPSMEGANRFLHDTSNVVWICPGTRGFIATYLPKFRERCRQRPAAREDHGALDEILEFANIARPFPGGESLHGSRGNTLYLLLHLFRKFLKIGRAHV